MRTRAALAAFVLLLGLSACAPAPEKTSDVPVRAALWKDPLSLSLVGNPDTNAEFVARLVTDSLVSLDARLQIVPQLATSWELGEDGRTLTFHLREGVRWHDGQPFTAGDVVFTWEKVMDPATRAKSFAARASLPRSKAACPCTTPAWRRAISCSAMLRTFCAVAGGLSATKRKEKKKKELG